ncbi:penicillin-binding protein 2 [Thermomicrobiaceae bacterium CFH 74404]|uniref:Penicillin-binding protein 2 n=2 Tax=Thermomicrobia TaxID=189775 RepID=A0AA42BDG7_9BACT|nr:penicillin-binding protein 2 [Thermalbibacter longus]MCM8749748.1 penicillin-binding protein 2 [Thermalbibacter longus]
MSWFIRTAALVAATAIVAYGVATTEDRTDPRWLALLLMLALLWGIALWPSLGRQVRTMDRTMVHVVAAFGVGFLLVGAQLVRVQALDRERIQSRIYSTGTEVVADPRRQALEEESQRGRILASDGTVIAETQMGDDGRPRRVYPFGPAAYLAGYYSPALYGATNLELSYDAALSGRSEARRLREWVDGILNRPTPGYDIVLTIDPELQSQADRLLGGRPGGIVVLDAHTGAVLAMASAPTFDPNQLSVGTTASEEELTAARTYWESLQQSNDGRLVLRPTQGRYPPGSTFKTITLAGALESGLATLDKVYRDEGALTVDSRVIIEQNRPDPNRVSYTLEEGYGYSLNVVFAQLGLELGASRLTEAAQRFGFGEPIPFDLPVAPSALSVSPEHLTSPAGLAETSFGQGQLLVTPLQMALVTAAVVNDGQIAVPRLVDRIQTPAGEVVDQRQPETWRRAMSADTAAQIERAMRWSVEQGYASGAQIPGAIVGGKTGTAEVGDRPPHAWFIGFAGREEPQYVVAVVVENAGSGSEVALPIGKALLEAALQR